MGLKYSEVNVAADPQAKKELMELTGRMAVPVTVINGAAVVGFDEVAMRALLS